MEVTVNISDIIVDPKIYPRVDTNWMKIFHYRVAMEAGAVFPPIEVGEYKGKRYLIDGLHRTKANESIGQPTVKAIVEKYSSKKDMFIKAVALNNTHGLPLTVMDKALIFARLQEYNVPKDQMSRLLGTPVEKFKVYIDKLVTVKGQEVPIASILEKAIKNQVISEADAKRIVEADQQGIYVSRTVVHAFQQLIDAVKQGAVDWSNPEVNALATELTSLLNGKLILLKGE